MINGTRDLLNHAGKGDKPRTRLDDNYRHRYGLIKGFSQFPEWSFRMGRRGKFIKKYK